MPDVPFQPIYDKVLLEEVAEEQKTSGGIIKAPSASNGSTQKGRVVAAGDGVLVPSTGELLDLKVEEGDTVLFDKKKGTSTRIDGNEYILIRQDGIHGTIE